MPLIYIAEDDPGIRELILYTLQVSGFEAKGFETGTALLEAVQGTRPDLVMLDIMMPGKETPAEPRDAGPACHYGNRQDRGIRHRDRTGSRRG